LVSWSSTSALLTSSSGASSVADDPAFIAERRRVRTLFEHTTEHEVSDDLRGHMRTLDEEFIRRARIAWQHAT
jgi:hypothetical protein